MFSLLTVYHISTIWYLFELKSGKLISLTGHPFGNPEVTLWHHIESLDLGLNLWVQHPELQSGLWPEKNYDRGIVDHETIMTELVSMVKSAS